MSRVSSGNAAIAAGLAAIGAAGVALPYLGALFAVDLPRWTPTAVGSGRALAATSLLVVAAWFASERDGPAGFTALLGASFGVLTAVAAVVVAPSVLGGAVVRAAGAMQFVATGVFFLTVGVAAHDDRLSSVGEGAAAVVGLLTVGSALLPVLRLLALAGWVGWCGWLCVRLVVGDGNPE